MAGKKVGANEITSQLSNLINDCSIGRLLTVQEYVNQKVSEKKDTAIKELEAQIAQLKK